MKIEILANLDGMIVYRVLFKMGFNKFPFKVVIVEQFEEDGGIYYRKNFATGDEVKGMEYIEY